jgi:hypothetical protein
LKQASDAHDLTTKQTDFPSEFSGPDLSAGSHPENLHWDSDSDSIGSDANTPDDAGDLEGGLVGSSEVLSSEGLSSESMSSEGLSGGVSGMADGDDFLNNDESQKM